jgi:hypothetical protein
MHGQAYPGVNLKELPQPEDIAPAFVKLTAENCPFHGEVVHASALLHKEA